MDVSRLNRDELTYELKVRGVGDATNETARSMRGKLKELMANETFGAVVHDDSFQPDNLEEINICNDKIVALEEYLNSKDIVVTNSNEARLVETKLRHLYKRLGRLTIPDNDENQQLLVSCTNLFKQLNILEEQLDIKVALSEDDIKPSPSTSNVGTASDTHTASAPVSHVTNVYKNNSTPVYKWDISFSGKLNTISVNAFLERVNEYRRSRHVSERDLLDSLEDLLRDKALLWYRSVRSKINSWDKFVEALRAEYLGHDYQINLWEEIRRRFQKPQERVGEYFACMLNMFNRLPQKPSEEEELNLLRRNIDPYFIDRLALVETCDVEDLLEKCKKLEISRDLAFRSKTPNRVCCLEPDLACDADLANSSPNTQHRDRVNISSVRCWNCGTEGHSFSKCRVSRTKQFCFRCGKPDVTKYTCTCNSKNGARGRRYNDRRPQQ